MTQKAQDEKRSSEVDDVQKLYTKNASLYERFFINFLGWGSKLEAFFHNTDYIKPNFRILDAGCGTGIITRTLYQLTIERGLEGVRFFGFDLTENMLEVFRQWIAAKGAGNIELKQADVLHIETLPADWSDFDLIVTSTMLEYLPKDKVKDAVSNLKRLLKNGGTLLVFITKRSIMARIVAGLWWKARTYRRSEIKTLFESVGFEKVELRTFSATSWWNNYILAIEAVK
jgi:ubiquinone/menaquinone biosynthesis C-methylase UbiE